MSQWQQWMRAWAVVGGVLLAIGAIAGAGQPEDDADSRQREPVVFADNFMRTADEPGPWTPRSGQWGLQTVWDVDPVMGRGRFRHAAQHDTMLFRSPDHSLNPFAWEGRGPDGPALCTAGSPRWEDYTMSVSVCPAPDGAVGVAVNLADARNGILVRWSPADDRGLSGDRLTLCKMTDGHSATLAEDRGGYVPGQWYRLTVVSAPAGIRVLVDGRERLAVADVTPRQGGVGLYAEGKTASVFDDVTVYGRTLDTDLIAETELLQVNERFQADRKGMTAWAAVQSDWQPLPGTAGAFVHRHDVYGEQWMSLTVIPNALPTGRLLMVLQGNGADLNAGSRALVEMTDDGKLRYALYRGTTRLAANTGLPLHSGEEYRFRFRRAGNRLQLELDGEVVIAADDATPAGGLRPAFSAAGCLGTARDVVVLSRNLRDDFFTGAPVDWIGEGAWMPTARWSCSPEWSFLAGWSRGDAVLWHKWRFTGDQDFEIFVAPKMEYPRDRDLYEHRYRDLGITICGDGRNPRSGYAAVYMASDAQGNHPARMVLLRNGAEVASAPVPYQQIPNKDNSHNRWFNLRLVKHGRTVDFLLNGTPALTFTDPNPLPGGIPALWTTDNGIAVARARIFYTEPPRPRTEPRVLIDAPDCPEWADVNVPLALDFPHTWSTTGRPAALRVTPREVPNGEDRAITVTKGGLTFRPAKPGEHWYEIHGVDGDLASPAYHLCLPVFNPALGRDDSHALVLYRFTEGEGKLVRDRSKIGPPADLVIPDGAETRWLPGQGLMRRGDMPLMTKGSVGKLMAIARSNACTIELWISTTTLYPRSHGDVWQAAMLSWESGKDPQNFSVGHAWYHPMLAPAGRKIVGEDWYPDAGWVFKTGLCHLVFTWNGTKTRCYVNGVDKGARTIPWNTEQWSLDASLLLGNTLDLNRIYLGTFYLVAIHDRCFTADQVKRHYQAGPAAK